MDDMERYGDYNEIDEPPSKNPVLMLLKIIITLVCVAVVGVIAFRIFLFNSYPDSMKNIYFNDTLTEFYNEKNGEIGATTQTLRVPYDDPDNASFFCDNLIVIKEAGQLQLSVRYNVSAIENFEKKYGVEGLSVDDDALLSFRLVDNYGRVYNDATVVAKESKMMYRYCKVVFDGIVFEGSSDGLDPEWIRIEFFIKDLGGGEPFSMVPVYENNDVYDVFTEYKLSNEEKPS